MRSNLARVAILTSSLATLSSRHAIGQRPAPDPRAKEVAVASGRDWLDARFSAIALGNTGCTGTDQLRPGAATRRWYQWQVTGDFADRRYPNNHLMSVILFFGLPEDVPLTAARLDSAIAATPIEVQEARGEPPMTVRRWVPKRAWARREKGRLHLRVEGTEAVQAFLRTGADSVSVLWCQRDEVVSAVQTRMRHQ